MRALIIFSWILALCLGICDASFANNAQNDARKALETSVNKIMLYIKDPTYQDEKNRLELNKKIESEVYSSFAFEEFSMRTVGKRWQSFTPEQKSAFTKAFANLLFSTYLDRIDGYSGEQIAYTGEVSNKAGNRVEVRTVVTLQGNVAVPVAYRMLVKDEKWYVYDVVIEGISLVKNYRTQFGDILSKESPEVLIVRINERGTALRNKAYDKN